MISIRPTQNPGRLKPTMEPPMISLPLRLAGFKPAHMPAGMPMTSVISMAKIASSSDAGSRSTISSVAGILFRNESPKSP